MNHKQRRKSSKTLRAYRQKTGRSPEGIAAQLGWPVAFYLEAEAGKAGLSKGQVDDVRRMLQKEIASAAIRDRLRSARRPGKIPLIGMPKLVPASPDPVGDVMRKHYEFQNMPRNPEDV